MARRHVADFMRHHQNFSGVRVKEPARQCESIDRVRIDYLDGERNLRIRIAHDVVGSVEQRFIAPGTRYGVEPVYDREQLIIAVLNLAFRVPAVLIFAVRDDQRCFLLVLRQADFVKAKIDRIQQRRALFRNRVGSPKGSPRT